MKDLNNEVLALAYGVRSGEIDREQLRNDVRVISKAYGIGYGYVLSRVACLIKR